MPPPSSTSHMPPHPFSSEETPQEMFAAVHLCDYCRTSPAIWGVADQLSDVTATLPISSDVRTADVLDDREWKELVCRQCLAAERHIDVGSLLKLARRCRNCSRWASYAPPSIRHPVFFGGKMRGYKRMLTVLSRVMRAFAPFRIEHPKSWILLQVHCKRHSTAGEEDVAHKHLRCSMPVILFARRCVMHVPWTFCQ